MKNLKIKLKISIGVIVALIFSYYVGSFVYWNLAAWGAMSIGEKITQKLNKLPSDELLKKITPLDLFSPYPGTAIEILVERKEKKVVPILIKFLNSKNEGYRNYAYWGLGILKDQRAIASLMNIVSFGEDRPNYNRALLVLSQMQYEPAFPYVVQLVKKDEPVPGIINMFENFGKPEGISLLLERRNKIKDDGSIGVRMNIKSYDEAIAHLESIQKEQEQQNKEKSPPTPIN